ncbi:hypothetical protein, partial [Acinetobacter schindleri]|uniref:hypothetical protein n=1 Tax=Acinetobacter schindleri TaxID=108981 RepID=UPI0030939B04
AQNAGEPDFFDDDLEIPPNLPFLTLQLKAILKSCSERLLPLFEKGEELPPLAKEGWDGFV